MSFYCSYNLRQQLNAATDKINWCSIIANALGNSRRIRCKRDPNANAPDAWTTGTEFRNVGSAGSMTIAAGMFADFGLLKGTQISLAADMSTGTSVLRIEGNGEWIQGTLGLSRAAQTSNGVGSADLKDYDFTVSGNFTANNGLGVAMAAFTLSGNRLLASGTGPHAPALDVDAPAKVEIWDWNDPNNPVLAGTIPFDVRRDDFVFEDTEVAAEMGDIAVYQNSQQAVLNKHVFGATLLVGTYTNGVLMSKPHYQVLVYANPNKAVQGWNSYPFMDTYGVKTNKTQPSPFKAIIKTADGRVLHMYEMQDGLPINSPQLAQGWNPTSPIRPLWNIGMMLPWENQRPSVSIHQKARFNGHDTSILRPTNARNGDAVLGRYPPISEGYNANSMYHLYALPKWPLPKFDYYGGEDWNAYMANLRANDTTIDDPNLFPSKGYTYRADEGCPWAATGWGYEPGSNGGQDWYTGPGGPRFDRSVMPSVYSLWATKNDYTRPKGAVSIQDMQYAWSMNYFNQANHFVADIATMGSVDVTNALMGQYAFNWAYYSVRPSTNDHSPSNVVEISSVTNGSGITDDKLDADGLRPFNGWTPDALHAYNAVNITTMLWNSPMHAIAGKFRLITSKMAELGENKPDTNPWSYFLQRTHAWRWMHLTLAWKNASRHALGVPRATIETVLQIGIEAIYDQIYSPVMLTNGQSPEIVILRRLGVQSGYTTTSSTINGVANTAVGGLTSGAGGLGYYLGQTYALMKITGLWDVMRGKSAKCDAVLPWLIKIADMGSVDYVLDTGARDGGYPAITLFKPEFTAYGNITPDDIPQSWTDWATNYYPVGGNATYPFNDPPANKQDMIRDLNGNILPGGYETEVNIHWRAQWPSIHKAYFPEAEYANPRLDAAIAKYAQFDADVAAGIAAGTNQDWHWRYPSGGPIVALGTSDAPRQ